MARQEHPMMGLRRMQEPTYETIGMPGESFRLSLCSICSGFVRDAETHTAWHMEVVAWLRALRDGKAEA